MRLIILIMVLLLPQQQSNLITAQQTSCGKRLVEHQALITLGLPTRPGDWPWAAAIYHVSANTARSSSYVCGGTVLSSNIILTAAHCVYEEGRQIVARRIRVQLGKHNLLRSDSHTQEFQALQIEAHSHFNPTNYENDIAIIQLSTEATLTDYVQPICLWESNKIEQSEVINKVGTVTGWGITEKDEVSEFLLQASMPVVSFVTCLRSNDKFFSKFLSDNNFCAGYRNGTGACDGDSGGGLVFEENGIYRIRGIISLSPTRQDRRFCNTTEYVIFTDVAKYLPWIYEKVPELKDISCTIFHTITTQLPTTTTTTTTSTTTTTTKRPVARPPPLPTKRPFDMQYNGCYTDKAENRAYMNFNLPRSTNTVHGCASKCYQNNMKYSATEYGYECFCGQTLPNPGSHPVKPESACNRKCEGDRSKNCGGRWAISVYSTGL